MTDTETKINPIVHLGGSGKQNLLAQYRAVCENLRFTLEALHEAAPHPRDYLLPVMDRTAYNDARFEHMQQVAALEDLRDQYQALMIKVDEQ